MTKRHEKNIKIMEAYKEELSEKINDNVPQREMYEFIRTKGYDMSQNSFRHQLVEIGIYTMKNTSGRKKGTKNRKPKGCIYKGNKNDCFKCKLADCVYDF